MWNSTAAAQCGCAMRSSGKAVKEELTMILNETYTLANGTAIPKLGLGT